MYLLWTMNGHTHDSTTIQSIYDMMERDECFVVAEWWNGTTRIWLSYRLSKTNTNAAGRDAGRDAGCDDVTSWVTDSSQVTQVNVDVFHEWSQVKAKWSTLTGQPMPFGDALMHPLDPDSKDSPTKMDVLNQRRQVMWKEYKSRMSRENQLVNDLLIESGWYTKNDS